MAVDGVCRGEDGLKSCVNTYCRRERKGELRDTKEEEYVMGYEKERRREVLLDRDVRRRRKEKGKHKKDMKGRI